MPYLGLLNGQSGKKTIRINLNGFSDDALIKEIIKMDKLLKVIRCAVFKGP